MTHNQSHTHMCTQTHIAAMTAFFLQCAVQWNTSQTTTRGHNTSDAKKKNIRKEEENITLHQACETFPLLDCSIINFAPKISSAQLQKINDCSELTVVAGAQRSSNNRLRAPHIFQRINKTSVITIPSRTADKELLVKKSIGEHALLK